MIDRRMRNEGDDVRCSFKSGLRHAKKISETHVKTYNNRFVALNSKSI